MKKVYMGFVIAFLFLSGISVHADLIAYWPMDEGSGNDIEDVVGLGGFGTFVGSPSWVEGKVGNGVECSAGNHISVPGNAELQPESVSATMWVYFHDVAPPRQDFFSMNDAYALSLHEWIDDGTIYPIIHGPADWTIKAGTVQIEAERWYHVALVYDVDSEDLLSYIDGEEDARTTAPNGIAYFGGNLTLGDYNNGRPLKGIIDEVKIWNEPLSQADIQADMSLEGTEAVSSRGKLTTVWGRVKLSE